MVFRGATSPLRRGALSLFGAIQKFPREKNLLKKTGKTFPRKNNSYI
jgi:hypothetical protein